MHKCSHDDQLMDFVNPSSWMLRGQVIYKGINLLHMVILLQKINICCWLKFKK